VKVYGTLLDDLGFACLRLSGRSPLIRWIKKNATEVDRCPLTGKVETWIWEDGDVRVSISKAYPKGYSLFITGLPAPYVSVLRAGYEAALEVLKKHGIDGWVYCRLD